jgi:predicted ATP-binding protein involved in virulence
LKEALKDALAITGWTSVEYLRWKKMIFATNANTGDRVPWTSLSAGNRIVIGLIADIAHRCCKLNPLENANALRNTSGIVLVDEIELHLHPSWQQQILPMLQKIFPKIQFIVTTHSPQVISSVPKECVRVINGGQVASFDIQTQGVEVGDILEGIFGTYPTPFNLEIVRKLNQLSAMVSEGLYDTGEWQKLYQELEGYYGRKYGPLAGIVEHRNFLKRLNKERGNA